MPVWLNGKLQSELHWLGWFMLIIIISQFSATPSLRGSEADGLTEAERKYRKAMEYEEEEAEQAEPQVLREAEINIPKLPLPTSSDNQASIHPICSTASC
jgi:hypothetical protein